MCWHYNKAMHLSKRRKRFLFVQTSGIRILKIIGIILASESTEKLLGDQYIGDVNIYFK